MATAIDISLKDLQAILKSMNLPDETKVSLTLENELAAIEIQRKRKALEAMKKLKGSGTGNLVNVLLNERTKDLEK